MGLKGWRLELRAVIVNTKTERAFRGVLWRRRGGVLVLKQAEMLEGGGQVTPLEGELVLFEDNVDFVQAVGR